MKKRGAVGKIYGMKYSRKGHKDRNRHKNRIKRSGKTRLVYVKNTNHSIPTMRRCARGNGIEGGFEDDAEVMCNDGCVQGYIGEDI